MLGWLGSLSLSLFFSFISSCSTCSPWHKVACTGPDWRFLPVVCDLTAHTRGMNSLAVWNKCKKYEIFWNIHMIHMIQKVSSILYIVWFCHSQWKPNHSEQTRDQRGALLFVAFFFSSDSFSLPLEKPKCHSGLAGLWKLEVLSHGVSWEWNGGQIKGSDEEERIEIYWNGMHGGEVDWAWLRYIEMNIMQACESA